MTPLATGGLDWRRLTMRGLDAHGPCHRQAGESTPDLKLQSSSAAASAPDRGFSRGQSGVVGLTLQGRDGRCPGATRGLFDDGDERSAPALAAALREERELVVKLVHAARDARGVLQGLSDALPTYGEFGHALSRRQRDVLQAMAKHKGTDAGELVYERGIGYLDLDRVSGRTVFALLRACAISCVSGEPGGFEVFVINETGEAIVEEAQ